MHAIYINLYNKGTSIKWAIWKSPKSAHIWQRCRICRQNKKFPQAGEKFPPVIVWKIPGKIKNFPKRPLAHAGRFCSSVVTVDDDVLVVIFSGFVGARMTNFNNKERVTAIIVKTIKEIPMILIQRWCHHLDRLWFPMSSWMYAGLLCIIF